MLERLIPLLILGALLLACRPETADIHEKIAELQKQGKFTKADEMIGSYMEQNPGLDSARIRQLRYEIERGRRIRYDYRLTEDKIYQQIQARFDSVSRSEFEQWQQNGWFDMLVIDGEKRFVGPSVSNLLFRHPELKERLKNYDPYSRLARVIDAHVEELRTRASATPDPVLFPRTCRVRQTLTIGKGEVPPSEIIRCWLPYPSVFATQGDIRFRNAAYQPLWLAGPASTIRSVYFESPMPVGKDLQFDIEYDYTAYAFFRSIDPSRVIPGSKTDPVFNRYTREEPPHEVFSDELRRLCSEIVAGEENPYIKGRRIYDWIADNIRYSYAREYSTLRNISAYCLENRYGDCGQEAILFITLCRIAEIPARWQSGFMTFPGDEGMHDWAEIYIRPYGWLPVDPYMGIFFTSVTEDLDPARRQELRDFYYGNIDHFRLVANKGHNQELYPVKKHFRSETVDFQRGEVESDEGNLYFNRWRWSIAITDISSE